ncbi:PEP-CTERM -sorting domain protein [Lyngbya aestuarii BL J]|uniref:PEP-CTERM-sorting domain protein n=1 Tax=Lyngbya aestuarii BL J TaxID=1348334 RepID=U7QBH8_9CYAN|nr:LEVG family PEP-CTERM protein [Lyngbya aestuarii]ERT04547.1 PEP-CTERM -sorting domain protein [Lyngbya aestuarii BL J]
MTKSLFFRSLLATTTTVAISAMASSGYAVSLVPDSEGEIDVGLSCLDAAQCIEPESLSFVESIMSETDETTSSRSRLFIDDLTTENVYGDDVSFLTTDAGTNPADVWFRPVAYLEDTDSYPEEGQLEVGTYTFEFGTLLKELTIEYFDAESENTTGVVALNGNPLASPDWVPDGSNGNVFTQTFADVSSLTLKLGLFDPEGMMVKKPGDGVRFRLAATPATVPEPTTISGLAAVSLALAGSKLRKRDQA